MRRLSFVAGWAALVLLAVVGFAAFGTPAEPSSLDAQTQTAAIGHTSGAYAGLAFAYSAGEAGDNQIAAAGSLEQSQDSLDSPPATVVSTEVDATGWLSQIQVRAIVSKFFAATDVNHAVRVAWCESRFNPESVNLRTGGVGLFQHLPQYWPDRAAAAGFPGADPTDAEASAAAAAWEVYNGGGWDVFNCRA